jgi:hypothetical protein
MATYPVQSIVNGQPTFSEPLKSILSGLKEGGCIKTLSPLEHHTDRQRRWYKGVCLKGLSDWNGDTVDEWDYRLKSLCNGNELLKTQVIYMGFGKTCERLTIVGVCKKNLTQFIENILSLAVTEDWPVTPPDPDLRKER